MFKISSTYQTILTFPGISHRFSVYFIFLGLSHVSEDLLSVSIVHLACCHILLIVIGTSIQCASVVTCFKFASILNEHLSFNFNPH